MVRDVKPMVDTVVSMAVFLEMGKCLCRVNEIQSKIQKWALGYAQGFVPKPLTICVNHSCAMEFTQSIDVLGSSGFVSVRVAMREVAEDG